VNFLEQLGDLILGLLGLRPGPTPKGENLDPSLPGPAATRQAASSAGAGPPGSVGQDLGKGLQTASGDSAPAPQPDPLITRIDVALAHGAPFGIAQVLAGASLDHDLSVLMLTKIAKIESSFRPTARNDTDRPPSVGLMGIKSNTAAAVMGWSFSQAEIEARLTDPRINALVGCRTLNGIKANRGTARASESVLVEMFHLGETRYLKGERDPGYMGRYNAA